MKSKKDMQKVVVALSMALNKKQITGNNEDEMTKDEASKACAVIDVLLWAMDYPNNFKKFSEPVIKMCPIRDDAIDLVFDEAVNAFSNKDTDTFTE